MNPNQAVWIHAMGSYYAGTVVKVTPKRALVRYTSGAGTTREKWVTFDPKTGHYINAVGFALIHGSQPKPSGSRGRA